MEVYAEAKFSMKARTSAPSATPVKLSMPPEHDDAERLQEEAPSEVGVNA
jgi:hypothetical protein